MWNGQNKSEIACVFASLILNENKIEISEISLKKILIAAKIKVESYWFFLFPKLVNGIDINNLIGNSSLVEDKTQYSSKISLPEKKEKKDSESSSDKISDEDMGFGLFD
mmetsp:Transcript_15991/g.32858  ORF Transcript_15991/g.32858 Transcript_15991/m.32858 type:complete len:109 (+) Transcript_15991:5635-5961(+)